jgi:hypothetical protein
MKNIILFLQLPTPLTDFNVIRENTLNAAANLISFIKSRNLQHNYKFILCDQFKNDNYGNAKLIDEILKYKPAIVCFTCYCWNIQRTLFICKVLKESKIKVVLGGPEINSDNSFLYKNNCADILISGEGEKVFYNLVKNDFDVSKKKNQLTWKVMNRLI